MPTELENEFHEAMVNIYRRANNEANYDARRFFQMVSERGGLNAAKMLINSSTVSDGYTALWEKRRLDLTVEALVSETKKYHSLFTPEELAICAKRLTDYGYESNSRR